MEKDSQEFMGLLWLITMPLLIIFGIRTALIAFDYVEAKHYEEKIAATMKYVEDAAIRITQAKQVYSRAYAYYYDRGEYKKIDNDYCVAGMTCTFIPENWK